MANFEINVWLPTGLATRTIGVSADTLKRYADQDQFLIEGQHWRRGPHQNSPRVWHVPSCIEAMAYRGRIRQEVQA
jgi:hypothetical protein